MNKGLCWDFTMLGLIVEAFVVVKGMVAVIGVHVWLSSKLVLGIFTQQKLAQMISEMWLLFRSWW